MRVQRPCFQAQSLSVSSKMGSKALTPLNYRKLGTKGFIAYLIQLCFPADERMKEAQREACDYCHVTNLRPSRRQPDFN